MKSNSMLIWSIFQFLFNSQSQWYFECFFALIISENSNKSMNSKCSNCLQSFRMIIILLIICSAKAYFVRFAQKHHDANGFKNYLDNLDKKTSNYFLTILIEIYDTKWFDFIYAHIYFSNNTFFRSKNIDVKHMNPTAKEIALG